MFIYKGLFLVVAHNIKWQKIDFTMHYILSNSTVISVISVQCPLYDLMIEEKLCLFLGAKKWHKAASPMIEDYNKNCFPYYLTSHD